MAATVVPHDPAPMTANCSPEAPIGHSVDRDGPEPYSGAMPAGSSATTAVIIPVKSFTRAKERLSSHLDPVRRRRLARGLADRVVAAVGGHPVFVACDDPEVADWAVTRDCRVLWGAGLGLNGALDAAVSAVADAGHQRALICHADLARPDALGALLHADTSAGVPAGITARVTAGVTAGVTSEITARGSVVIVPDRRGDGTNALIRPTTSGLTAAYGPGSFVRHLAAARRAGHAVTVRIDHRLALDVDTWADICHPLVRPVVDRLLDPDQDIDPPTSNPAAVAVEPAADLVGDVNER